jgi:phenylacetate-coenzyme A ligase PaaK-like adenylate-forming protein
MDEIAVRVEWAGVSEPGVETTAQIVAALRTKIGVRPNLVLVPPNTLARTDLKSRRVRDERGLYSV